MSLREIRRALLEADVGLEVAKTFCEDVRARALGADVLQSLNAHQVIVKVVNDALVDLMGPVDPGIPFNTKRGVTVLLMAGLQGSGKTTTCAKLGLHLRKKNPANKPLLVAADLKRPGAVEQLVVLGGQLELPVYHEEKGRPQKVCARGVEHALAHGHTVVILDTAGRLAIDDELMDELADIAALTQPDQTYLVCDGMLGQDAVRSARGFHERMSLDGVILTKLDGDSRGGAALSVKAVVGKPIKWIGTGESPDKFEEFRPEGMAQRILGMGDIVSLVEEIQDKVDQQEALKKTRALIEGTYSFDDFLDHIGMMKNMGDLGGLMEKMPGLGGAMKDELKNFDMKEFDRIEAMIRSMTYDERMAPDLTTSDRSARSRRERICKGSGATPGEFLMLHKQYEQMNRMFGMIGQQAGFKGMAGRLMTQRQKKKRRLRAKERGMLGEMGGGFLDSMMGNLGAMFRSQEGAEAPVDLEQAMQDMSGGATATPGAGTPGRRNRGPTRQEKKRDRQNRRKGRRK